MNEHKLAVPRDIKPNEIRVQKVSAGHAVIWKGDEWMATVRPELAEKMVEVIKQSASL